MTSKSGLGRGLSSLIPQKSTDEVIAPPASGNVGDSRTALEVAIHKVHHNPRQPRKNFRPEELQELMASIKKHGILQPLVVSIRDDGEYELIAGERRLRSAKELGMQRVPVITRTVNDQEKLELALIENIQREDLDALEEALAYKALIEEFNLTQDEVAKQVGKSRPTVANTIRLLDLPEVIQTALHDGKIGRSHARTLLAEKDPAKQIKLFEAILQGGVTVREVEAKAGTKKRSADKDPNVADLENQLQQSLGTKVTIQMKDGRGKVAIEFYSKEELRKLIDRLR
ncbi:MAG: ParB/RepB/Spo0J family partition protein [Candidatus Uhrbacteria bacterium]|nr:ParB/RepB/Spo0J family partition protein [Patescibacteria group bacterium]